MDFNKAWNLFINNQSLFMYGIKITLMMALIGTLAGLVIGLILGSIRAIEIEHRDRLFTKVIKRISRGLVSLYVWFFRGTPMMVQAIFIYTILRPIFNWDPLTAGICIVSVNTGAYMAEIIRSGIQSVDKGQIEGARSIGMSSRQTMMNIVLPQAIKNSFPSIGNEFIVNIKDSSMLNVIGVIELFFQAKSVAGSTMLGTETYFVTCLLYLVLTTLATWLLTFTEKRINQTKSSYPASQSVPNK